MVAGRRRSVRASERSIECKNNTRRLRGHFFSGPNHAWTGVVGWARARAAQKKKTPHGPRHHGRLRRPRRGWGRGPAGRRRCGGERERSAHAPRASLPSHHQTGPTSLSLIFHVFSFLLLLFIVRTTALRLLPRLPSLLWPDDSAAAREAEKRAAVAGEVARLRARAGRAPAEAGAGAAHPSRRGGGGGGGVGTVARDCRVR